MMGARNGKMASALACILATLGVIFFTSQNTQSQVVPQPGPPISIACAYNTSPATLTNGQAGWTQCDATGNLKTSTGASASSIGKAEDTPHTSGDTGVFNLGVANEAQNVQSQDGDYTPISTDTRGNNLVVTIPTALATAGITPIVTSVAASNIVLKASAGNLYGIELTTGGTAGYLMIFNATSAPADGTVTPIYCKVVAANSSIELSWTAGPPAAFSTGITAVFSSTGCFSKTASATAFISGMAK